MSFGIITNRQPEAIPKKCGDCNFCSPPETIFVEKVGMHVSFRCNHPHPMAKDWKGRRTGVDPDQPPEQMFCPLLNGIGKGFDLFRPKLTAHALAADIHAANQAAKNQSLASHMVEQAPVVSVGDNPLLSAPSLLRLS